MDQWTEIRRLVLTKQKSKRAICQEYRLHWKTLQKILRHAEPPGYLQRQSRAKPKLGHLLPIIHEILEQDKAAPPKQRHTIKRIFERLQTEHQYQGGISVVGDAVRAWRAGSAEVFMPPGEAQVDFGEATVILKGMETKVAYFVMSLPFSDAMFCQVFPRECTERRLKTDTVERLSSSAVCRRESLSAADRAERIEQAAEQLRYCQRRNQAARRSHDETRRAEVRKRGIPLAELRRCEPR